MTTAQWMIETVIGPLFLVASASGLKGVYWKKQKSPFAHSLHSSSPEVQHLRQAQDEILEYLRGARTQFQIRLDIDGTPFQKQVWSELAKIPYGKTLSYKDLAKKIKNEKAVRAVGTANGKNPLCIVIPCHRVIASNGSLGGFSGGLKTKQDLLALESEYR